MALSDILSATSIILVFVVLTFDKLNSTVESVLKIKVPDKIKKIEFDEYCSLLNSTLIKTSIVLSVLLILSYLFLPTALTILKTSKINLWKFDLLNTLFIVIEICILAMTFYVGNLTVKIINKRKKSCH